MGNISYRKYIIIIVLLIVAGILAGAFVYIKETYTVKNVYVEGNVHYTAEEIKNFVIGDGFLEDNSLYLSFKYRDKGIEDVPFVERMDVSIIEADSVRITVYEKALAGFVQYLDRYMYFDRDGVVVESSSVKTSGVPQVTGLKFDHVVLYRQLPVEKKEIFGQILNTALLLEKYGLAPDKIYFDNNYHMSLFFGDVNVVIGTDDNIEEKLMFLEQVVPELEGMKGMVDLSDYTGGSGAVTFRPVTENAAGTDQDEADQDGGENAEEPAE